jgi:hypothetical protein
MMYTAVLWEPTRKYQRHENFREGNANGILQYSGPSVIPNPVIRIPGWSGQFWAT